MKTISTVKEMLKWRSLTKSRVGFVPTMGALHRGHAELLNQARRNCDSLVLSIFVNPMQFGPKEDLSKYPRTLDLDLVLAQNAGVDVVFFPHPSEIYLEGFSTHVEETILSQPLCGKFRPGHFQGVTTVVLKLFNIVQPHVAYFGLKDAQQFFVIKKMAQDLNLNISIEGVATVRESDGLAMSSRNVYLSPGDRKKAPEIFQSLSRAKLALTSGAAILSILESEKVFLSKIGFDIQYYDLLTLPNLSPVTSTSLSSGTSYILAIAAILGTTRLIDNVIIEA